jgi:hypothetical protein
VPAQLGLRLPRPETLEVGSGFGAQRPKVGWFQAGLGGEFRGRREASFFDENGFDVLAAHGLAARGRKGYRMNCSVL